MRARADLVRFPNPALEVPVELVYNRYPELMYEKPGGIRRRPQDPRILQLSLQIQVAIERPLRRLGSGESSPGALECDGGLGHPVSEGPALSDEGNEALVEGDNIIRLPG